MIDAIDVLELIMLNAKEVLQDNYAKLIAAVPEFEAVIAGHTLTPSRRFELIATLEKWDDERIWFSVDNRGGVTLETVCDAAGTKVEIVRAFYQDFLWVPFNYKKAHSMLLWEANCAGRYCRICASERCEVPQTIVHDEGRTSGEGVAGPNSVRMEGPDSLYRTEETGHRPEGS